MDFTDVLLLLIRWLHALAAVSWVGGSIFYWLVLRPATRRSQSLSGPLGKTIADEFRSLVNLAMGVLLVTGAILAANRLTSQVAGTAYIAVLSVKIALALYMFYLVRFLRRRTYPEEPSAPAGRFRRVVALLSGTNAILVLGVIVFLLADILTMLVERGLRP